MSDRELIELAARAAGYKVIHSFENNDSLMIEVSERKYEVFNPLTSDSDAFRLVVKLRLEINFPEEDPPIVLVWGCNWGEEKMGADPYAATRRAITRAAAEIGRGWYEKFYLATEKHYFQNHASGILAAKRTYMLGT